MPEESPTKHRHESPPISSLKTLAAENADALDAADSVETAGQRLREHGANLWPVTEQRKLVGMAGEENPDWKIGGRGHDPKTFKVGEMMSREIVFCYEDEDCASARKLMDERNLRFLPVVDREMRIVGVFRREEIEGQTQITAPTGI